MKREQTYDVIVVGAGHAGCGSDGLQRVFPAVGSSML